MQNVNYQHKSPSTADSFGVCLQQPRYKSFADQNTRLKSFQSCTFCANVADTVRAGFYYTGTSDIVQCFYCGLKLRNWDPSDDPWVEHARHGKNCPFVINMKGKDYISSVLYSKDLDTGQDIETDSPPSSQTQVYTDDLIFTTAGQALLKMQCYKPRDVMEAIRLYVHKYGTIEFTAVEIATVIHSQLSESKQ